MKELRGILDKLLEIEYECYGCVEPDNDCGIIKQGKEWKKCVKLEKDITQAEQAITALFDEHFQKKMEEKNKDFSIERLAKDYIAIAEYEKKIQEQLKQKDAELLKLKKELKRS